MADGRYERELVNALDACGYVAMRAPSSGSATARDLPDVLALRRYDLSPIGHDALTSLYDERERVPPTAEVLAVELKSTSKNAAYVEPREVEALERFAHFAGARALLGVRFKRTGHEREHYLVPPRRAGRTQGENEGNYSVHVDDAPRIADLIVNASTNEITRP